MRTVKGPFCLVCRVPVEYVAGRHEGSGNPRGHWRHLAPVDRHIVRAGFAVEAAK